MKKLLLVAAALLTLSAGAMAQTYERHDGRPEVRRMDNRHHRARKVWVPAHRVHGRIVRGHYVWR
jgi:hypothetical protein